MAPLDVKIKHAGKVLDVQLDPDLPAAVFKDAVYQVTGVPPDRMKVMIKGGVLKDDTDWRKVAPKAGQTFMVIGAAGELPKPPSTPTQFLEDMDDTSLAQALALPVGLVNLGNTCYMNATLQAMRAIPELQTALQSSAPQGLPLQLRNLYTNMSSTTESVTPSSFLAALRHAFPQFAEQSRATGMKALMGAAYAQQDAEECWVQMTNALREVPGLPGPSSEASPSAKFVEQYMTGELRRVLKCDEAPEEPESVTFEKTLKVSCTISNAVNYMHQGIKEALDGKIEKHSATLGRDAVYSLTTRLSRLPSYLTVHMVRFAWKADINKKAKIMRRVKFPAEYDALEIATPELKEKLLPISRRLKELEKERAERRKVRKRTKTAKPVTDKEGDVQMADADAPSGSGPSSAPAPAPAPAAEGDAATDAKTVAVAGAELEAESVYREKEGKELEALVHPDLKADVGCSTTGQYELVAIVTHKGAEADAGHYIGFVKKRALHGATAATAAAGAAAHDEDDDDWYKFDDDRVSVFPQEKLETLSGGGQDASAYVLLYRTRPLV